MTPPGCFRTIALVLIAALADLNFRLDSLTHTFTGDLTVMLRAPTGYGTDLIYLRGEFTSSGNGDNFINTVIDDAAASDLSQTTPADAPFTGSFVPAFNGAVWTTFGIPTDPVGQLGRLNGLSTQGDWKVHVTDEAPIDTGTLNSWSLIVTPRNFVCGQPPSASRALASSILPSSRSAQVGGTATAFATIIAAGPGTATNCSIAPITNVPAFFSYQTTDPSTNALTGSPNTPVNIPGGGGSQTFVIAFNATGAFAPTDVQLSFDCDNSLPAGIISGVNTLLLSASSTPVPDIVALAATVGNTGIVNVTGGAAAFAVATVNVGASDTITASADTGSAVLPVSLSLCQTNPLTSACISPIGPTVTTPINANETPTFAIFVGAAAGTVPFDPATNRVFVRFKDPGNATRGSTSVAVTAP